MADFQGCVHKHHNFVEVGTTEINVGTEMVNDMEAITTIYAGVEWCSTCGTLKVEASDGHVTLRYPGVPGEFLVPK